MDERYFRAALEHRYALYPEIPVIAEFDGYRDRDVLEVGVGQGSDHFMFASGGARLAGIDLTPRHCEITRLLFATLGASTRLYRADARSLPFAAESFDHVYSCGVLLLVREMDRALSEIHRVLRPGGSTTIMLYNRSSVHYWLKTRLYYGWALGENTVLGRDTVLDWYRMASATQTWHYGPPTCAALLGFARVEYLPLLTLKQFPSWAAADGLDGVARANLGFYLRNGMM